MRLDQLYCINRLPYNRFWLGYREASSIMHTLQPHPLPGPAQTLRVCKSRAAVLTGQQNAKLAWRTRTCSAPGRACQQSSRKLQCSSQPHAELADHPHPNQDSLIQIDASVDALLTGEGEAEGEELSDFGVPAAYEEQQQQEENPYSPEDATR